MLYSKREGTQPQKLRVLYDDLSIPKDCNIVWNQQGLVQLYIGIYIYTSVPCMNITLRESTNVSYCWKTNPDIREDSSCITIRFNGYPVSSVRFLKDAFSSCFILHVHCTHRDDAFLLVIVNHRLIFVSRKTFIWKPGSKLYPVANKIYKTNMRVESQAGYQGGLCSTLHPSIGENIR